MNDRIFHGSIEPKDIAIALLAKFNRGNFRAQQLGNGDQVVVQIATVGLPTSGGQTALSVSIRSIEDGISIQLGRQAWLGIAASLGTTAIRAIRNPLSLLNHLDDIAQDIESFQLTEEVWQTVEQVARSMDVGKQLSDRLRRITCEYCDTANPVGQSSCIACGAPLGSVQPFTCRYCGFVLKRGEAICSNCGRKI